MIHLFFVSIFSVIGVHFYKGSFSHCTDDCILNRYACEAGVRMVGLAGEKLSGLASSSSSEIATTVGDIRTVEEIFLTSSGASSSLSTSGALVSGSTGSSIAEHPVFSAETPSHLSALTATTHFSHNGVLVLGSSQIGVYIGKSRDQILGNRTFIDPSIETKGVSMSCINSEATN